MDARLRGLEITGRQFLLSCRIASIDFPRLVGERMTPRRRLDIEFSRNHGGRPRGCWHLHVIGY